MATCQYCGNEFDGSGRVCKECKLYKEGNTSGTGPFIIIGIFIFAGMIYLYFFSTEFNSMAARFFYNIGLTDIARYFLQRLLYM